MVRTGSTSSPGRTSSWGIRRRVSVFMKFTRLLAVTMTGAGLLLPLLCFAQADQAVSRTDQNSMTAHAQLLEKAKKGVVDIYFEGDSITRRWGATDYPDFLASWKQNFFGWN